MGIAVAIQKESVHKTFFFFYHKKKLSKKNFNKNQNKTHYSTFALADADRNSASVF